VLRVLLHTQYYWNLHKIIIHTTSKHHKRYQNMLFLNSAINKAFGHSDDQAMGKSNKNNVSWSCGAMALACLRHGHHRCSQSSAQGASLALALHLECM
jgi:hypothetical protein